MKKLIYIFFLFASFSLAQTDWQKWEAKEVSYLLPTKYQVDQHNDSQSLAATALNFLKKVYSLTISDYDGENCPFTPSCADFFVESVDATNIVTGILIFADRFTRDMNFLKDTNHYALHKNGKYFDPSENYVLNLQQVKFEPDNND